MGARRKALGDDSNGGDAAGRKAGAA